MSLAMLFDLPWRRAVVVHRYANPHRLLARVLLGHFRSDSSDAPNDEHQLAEGRRKSQVVEDRGQGAVDVDRQRLDDLPYFFFERLHQGDARTRETSLASHTEQHGGARVCRVNAMSEPGDPLLVRASRCGEVLCRFLD